MKRKPRRVGRDAEGERVFLLAGPHRERQRIDHDLIGGRSVGRQHLGAAHDQAVAGFFDDAQIGVGVGLLRGGFAAVDRRIDQGVGEKQIVVAAIAIVPLHVVETFAADTRRRIPARRPATPARVLRKSGERPMMPNVASAQTRIALRRCTRSACASRNDERERRPPRRRRRADRSSSNAARRRPGSRRAWPSPRPGGETPDRW